MPRRKRGFGPGGACCHITQRCTNGEFLLKFKCDRRQYVARLREGLSRHAVSLLNYMVTCNHSHLLIWSERPAEVTGLMQYLAGTTAQDYNRRKNRRGAYWGDRYHVTLIQCGSHLSRCLLYVDMNMVRAGVVAHPSAWETGGCRELMGIASDSDLIDQAAVVRLLACGDMADFRKWHERTLHELSARTEHPREPWWTEAVAVGDRAWVAPLADRFAACSRTVRRIDIDDDVEVWAMGMSRRRREGFLNSFE